jgi:TolA-binding protein
MLQMAVIYRNKSDNSRAIDTYRSLIKNYPTSEEAATAVSDLKTIYAEQGRIDELDSFLKSVPSAPQLSEAERSTLAAQSLWKQATSTNDNDTALKLLTELTEKYPHAAEAEDALAMKADIEYATGRTEAAARDYNKLKEQASGPASHNAALLGIVRTSRDLGKNADVITAADQLLASSTAGNSYASEVRYARAAAYNATGRTADARNEWAALAKTPADIYGSKSAVALSESYYNAKEYTKALNTVNNFIDANPPHQYWLARGFIVLSDVLRKQGNKYEADEYLRTLRSNYPGSEADIFEMIDQRIGK